MLKLPFEGRRACGLLGVCVLLAGGLFGAERPGGASVGHDWAVRLDPGADPDALADSLGAENLGRIGALEDTFRFRLRLENAAGPDRDEVRAAFSQSLAAESAVRWSEEQVRRPRALKQAARDEPLFVEQWHLENLGQTGGMAGVDTGAASVWSEGFSGSGVGVAVVDTGTEYRHPDLQPNFVVGLDTWGGDNDPSPEGDEHHGTAVSGIVLAAANGQGGTGVAPGSRLYPVRLLRDGEGIPDADEVEALNFRLADVAVSNNSWGPVDEDGISLGPVGSLAQRALDVGVQRGRGGKGVVYVWAAGNGAENGDRSSYDGYASSRYTIAVGAIGQDGQATAFSEPGSNVFVAAPSFSGGRGITTTDRMGSEGYAPGDHTSDFSGTSAAAPMVSGVVALMLEANPALGWRDVQHILARTAVRTDHDDAGWFANGDGFHLHDHYGFGRVDALGAVRLAQAWSPLPAEDSVERFSGSLNLGFGHRSVARHSLTLPPGRSVESVMVTLALQISNWSGLEIFLESPAGTRSQLVAPFETQGASGFGEWTFQSVQFWGESSDGEWTLEIAGTGGGSSSGVLKTWRIGAFGPSVAEVGGSAPAVVAESVAVSSFPFALTDALLPGAGSGRILAAHALDRGRAYEVDGAWYFEPPRHGYGRFPVGLTVLPADARAARHLVAEVERPIVLAGGEGSPAAVRLASGAVVSQAPRHGQLLAQGGGLLYQAAVGGAGGVDRFSVSGGIGGRAVWYPVVTDSDFAFWLDGRDDYIEVSGPGWTLSDAFTLEFFFRPEGWGEAGTGFGRLFDSEVLSIFLNGFDHSFYPDGSFVIYTTRSDGSTAGFTTAAGSVRLGEWQHLAVSYEASRSEPVAVYLNGAPLAVTSPDEVAPESGSAWLGSDTAGFFRIGEAAAGNRAFRGAFGSVVVWDEARSAAQIADAARRVPAIAAEAYLGIHFREPASGQPTVTGRSGSSAKAEGGVWELRQAPWEPLEAYLPLAIDSGSGWWEDPRLGWLYADDFPWIYSEGMGWLYAGGRGAGSYWLYRRGALQWLYTNDSAYPWMYAQGRGEWVYHYVNSSWFYFPASGAHEELPDS